MLAGEWTSALGFSCALICCGHVRGACLTGAVCQSCLLDEALASLTCWLELFAYAACFGVVQRGVSLIFGVAHLDGGHRDSSNLVACCAAVCKRRAGPSEVKSLPDHRPGPLSHRSGSRYRAACSSFANFRPLSAGIPLLFKVFSILNF